MSKQNSNDEKVLNEAAKSRIVAKADKQNDAVSEAIGVTLGGLLLSIILSLLYFTGTATNGVEGYIAAGAAAAFMIFGGVGRYFYCHSIRNEKFHSLADKIRTGREQQLNECESKLLKQHG